LSADTSGISDDDGVGAFSYQWVRDGVAIGGAIASTYTLGDADVGALISVQVSYTDGSGTAESLTSAQTPPVTNVNDVPLGAPVVTGTVSEDQVLTADTSGISDVDGLGAFSYQWLRDGVAIGGATASTYTLGDSDVGAQISVQVSYVDGWGTAESVMSLQTPAVANVNDAPAGLPLIPGTVAEDQTLAVDTSGISDDDGLGAFNYQWMRDGVAIIGATGNTYTLGDADVGTQISVQVSYIDAQGTAETITSAATAAVANVNDAPAGVPVITGSVTEDQVLTADTSGISDADGLGVFSYQWLRDGVAIGGATAGTYTLSDADVGTQISVQVSYTDGWGTPESLISAQTAAVVNVNDVPVGLPVITGTVTEDQVLMADTSAINDADGLGAFSYQWLRNGIAIGGANVSTYTLGDADVGTQISVQVSYTDGWGTPESVTSAQTAAVANVNDAPAGVPVITGTVTEDQVLTADTSGISDADGLGVFSYQWLRDGVAIGGATASTYTLGDADVGTQISVRVSYTDGLGTGEGPLTSAATAPVSNLNDAPVGLPMISGSVMEDQTLTADASGIADADGLGAFSYQWLRNGSAIGGATASTYLLGSADVGALISVQVTYSDGWGTNESVTSAQTAPVVGVNDEPAGTDGSVLTSEDTPYVFATVDFGFTDVGDTPPDTLNRVLITTLPGSGALTLNGVAVNAGDYVTLAQLNAGQLVYTPAADANGAAITSMTFQVEDNGGTLNGGVNLDASPNVLTFDVAAVNDAPVNTLPGSITVTEDVGAAVTGISVADVDAGGTPIQITLSVASGQLASASAGGVTVTGSGTSVLSLSGTVANLNAFIAGSAVTFTTAANATAPVALTVTSNDLGNSGAGGAQSTTGSVVINVTPVDDAPVLVSNAISVTQGGAAVLGAGQMAGADVDSAAASLVFTVSSVTAGHFELVSAPGVAVSSFTQADLNANRVRFVQDGSSQAPVYTILLSDGTTTVGPYNGTVTFAATPAGTSSTPSGSGQQPEAPPEIQPAVLASAAQPREAPAPLLPVQFSPGRPDGAFNDLAAMTVEMKPMQARPLPKLVQPVLSYNDYEAPPAVDVLFQLFNFTPAHLEYQPSTPADWQVAPAFEQGFEDEAQEQLQLMLDSVKFGGMALSVGVVWWASRISAMLGSLLASTPAWRHIDPLPVVGDSEEEEKEKWLEPDGRDVDADELAVALVLEGRLGGNAKA
jgi:hypothetical protein